MMMSDYNALGPTPSWLNFTGSISPDGPNSIFSMHTCLCLTVLSPAGSLFRLV